MDVNRIKDLDIKINREFQERMRGLALRKMQELEDREREGKSLGIVLAIAVVVGAGWGLFAFGGFNGIALGVVIAFILVALTMFLLGQNSQN